MEKNALCACKNDYELENVRFRQRRFLIWFRKRSQLCFDFEVAYSDGVVSRLVKDRKKRTPVGIVVRGWLILRKDAPKMMTWAEGIKYCADIKVSGKGCQLCPVDLRCFLVNYGGGINSLLCDLGLEPFDDEFYFCQETSSVFHDSAYCFCQSKAWRSIEDKTSLLRIRPMIKLY